ncbi:tetratricopeptide repeat protein [Lysobacter korlensis]|uniref:Tetratricopeptide repeat protein n=1 Tax=Lysobacter korlensis TaxID=553636 RepID=A0ABV6RH31_9GAMM
MRAYLAARAQLLREAGESHPLLIPIGRRLAALHREHGRLPAAERNLRDAVRIAIETNGPQHPGTLTVRRELGEVLLMQGRHTKAAREFDAVHQGLVERHGEGHAELRDSHRMLAQAHWQRGDTETAETQLRAALVISRRGGDPDQVAEVQLELGELLHETGRAGAALPLVRQAVALRRARHGAAHGLTADAERLLAEIDASIAGPGPGPGSARTRLQRPVERADLALEPPPAGANQAELVLARRDITAEDASALARLDPGAGEPALQPAALRARASAAEALCRRGGDDAARAALLLDLLLADVRRYEPTGGTITREVEAIRRQCSPVDANPGGTVAAR